MSGALALAKEVEGHPDEILVFRKGDLEALLEQTRAQYGPKPNSKHSDNGIRKGYLKKTNAAKYADVSETTIVNWVKRGYINSYMTDGNTLYKVSEIDTYLASGKVGTA